MANVESELKTPLHIREALRAKYAVNPEPFKARSRAYRQRNRDDVNARNRQRAAEQRERERKASWETYQQNPPDKNLPSGKQLRSWLDAKGWSVRHLAREIGVSTRSSFDWLSGKHPPVGQRRQRLSELTGLECFHAPVREKRPKYDEEAGVAATLLKELVVTCGLASREIIALKVPVAGTNGLVLEDGRLIPFVDNWHDGWHHVRSDSLNAWMSVARPEKYLFFQHKPVSRHRPASRLWLARMLKKAGVSMRRSQTPRVQHFAGDAKRFGAGPRLLKHLREFHRLSKTHSITVWKDLIADGRRSGSVSGLSPKKTPVRKGGAPRGTRTVTDLRVEMMAAAKAQGRGAKDVYPDLLFKGQSDHQYTRCYGFCSEYRKAIESRKAQIIDAQADAGSIYTASKKALLRAISLIR